MKRFTQSLLRVAVQQRQCQKVLSQKMFSTKIKSINSLQFQSMRHFSIKTVEIPTMGDSITEGSVFELNKKEGDFAELDEIIAVIETDKVKVDIRSPESGKICKFFAQEGDTVEVGKPFFEIDASVQGTSQPAAQETVKQETKVETKEQPKIEVKQEQKKVQQPQQVQQQQPIQQAGQRTEKREKMSRMRLKIAERLKESQNTYALLTTFQEVDMSTVMSYRTQLQDKFVKKHDVKLGFMSFFIKACTQALKDQPIVNAVIDGQEIVYRDFVDISVAVATPSGLMVPVIRDCQEKSFAELEKTLIDLGNKGKNGKITLEDMSGGTFTISNGGVFGSMMGTPILNPPQSAILGMHNIITRPVCVGDQIVARPMMYLALTYDHRLIDGKEAATFLVKVRDVLQDPKNILFDL